MGKCMFANLTNISEADLNILQSALYKEIEDLSNTELANKDYLKEEFFERKSNTIFIHQKVCELLEAFELNTIAEDHTRELSK